jgi:hypothetical protein
MAVTPDQVRKYVTKDDQDNIARLEKFIDGKLMAEQTSFMISSCSERVLRALLSLYEKAWKVDYTYGSDRNEDYVSLKFTERPKSQMPDSGLRD